MSGKGREARGLASALPRPPQMTKQARLAAIERIFDSIKPEERVAFIEAVSGKGRVPSHNGFPGPRK